MKSNAAGAGLVMAAMLAGCTVLWVGEETCCMDINLETTKDITKPELPSVPSVPSVPGLPEDPLW